jgi:hypothetical protein
VKFFRNFLFIDFCLVGSLFSTLGNVRFRLENSSPFEIIYIKVQKLTPICEKN